MYVKHPNDILATALGKRHFQSPKVRRLHIFDTMLKSLEMRLDLN